MTRYAATKEEWHKVVDVCFNAPDGIIGIDTETYGHDIEESTAPHRARVHVWSVAVRSATYHPYGHRVASGVVLPAAALVDPVVRALLEDPLVFKVAHNAPHDIHSIGNHGVTLRGCRDSLPRARVVYVDEQRHGLKSVCSKVGRTLTPYEVVLAGMVDKTFMAKQCECGKFQCLKRKVGHEVKTLVPVVRSVPGVLPLESVTPGHSSWDKLVEYAAEDAVTALELWEAMDLALKSKPLELPEIPWTPEWSFYE